MFNKNFLICEVSEIGFKFINIPVDLNNIIAKNDEKDNLKLINS